MEIWVIILAYVSILNGKPFDKPEIYGDLSASRIEQRVDEFFMSKEMCELALSALIKPKDKLIEVEGQKVLIHLKATNEQAKFMQLTVHSKCLKIKIPPPK